jgi:hypothetical protein
VPQPPLRAFFEALDVGNISVNVLRDCLASEHAGSPAEIEHMRLKLRHTLQVHFDHYVHSPEIQLEDFGGGNEIPIANHFKGARIVGAGLRVVGRRAFLPV